MQKYVWLSGAAAVAALSTGCATGGDTGATFSALSFDAGPSGSASNPELSSSGQATGATNDVGNDASSPATGDDTRNEGDGGTVTGDDAGQTPNADAAVDAGNGNGNLTGNASSGGASTGNADSGTTYASLPYRGLSLSGAEFGASVSGQFNGTTLGKIPGDYYYPTSDLAKGGPSWPAASNGTAIETDLMNPYFLGKGMNTIRLPVRWERLQHDLSNTSSGVLSGSQVVATFDTTELAALKAAVSNLTTAGFTVLIDIHNYAWYTNANEIASTTPGDPLGSANVPNVAFENLWIGLASIYAGDPKVVFDLMNEPNSPPDPAGQPAGTEWYQAAQAAVTGIRGVGAGNLVLICGNDYAGPGDFKDGGISDPLKNIQDPQNNFAFEVHDYPDNAYGTSDTCTTDSAQTVLTDLQTFVTWAGKHGARGFLGEFSAGVDVSADAECQTAVQQMLTLVSQNPSVFLGWTYWAGGAGFGSSEPMNYPFFHPGHDSPQMQTLAAFL
ncbi:MAG TPA: glycoside hydrolase family 5 protein [Polyangiaceae bacterium]|nr:glycoside hydrolase family 5 protein [Polyangiaceae bacterium]